MARGIMGHADERVLRNIEAFDAEHGGHEAAVEVERTWLLFPDGAMRQVYLDFGCPLNQPPTEPLELARLKRRYAEVRLEKARAEFTTLKRAMQLRAAQAIEHARSNAPPPAPSTEDVARLRGLQRLVHERQAELQAAEEALADARPQWQKDRDAQAEAALPGLLETQRIIAEIQI